MEPLKIGITGVRGVVGQTLTPELVVRFAEAFGSYLDGGRVLVCRDPRPSGPMVQAAVTAGLHPTGTVNAGAHWCAQRLVPPKSARR